jgi:hypothetical protein
MNSAPNVPGETEATRFVVRMFFSVTKEGFVKQDPKRGRVRERKKRAKKTGGL